jgi:diguanylate cyclase (GGDEF)-like protein
VAATQQTMKLTKNSTLEKLSWEDGLTGLYNRHRFNHVVEELSRRVPEQLAVAYMDLNNLKYTNDTFGHEAGDSLIRTAANIIRAVFGEMTFRIGGDEFVALRTDTGEEALREMLGQMNALMEQHRANVSVGYSYRFGNVNIQEQTDAADNAMYVEKQNYRKLHSKR